MTYGIWGYNFWGVNLYYKQVKDKPVSKANQSTNPPIIENTAPIDKT